LIDPGGNPDASVLYLKLTPMPPFGLQMPEIGNKLDEAQLACVAAWIMAAASTPAAAATSDAGAGMTTLTGDAGLPED
jgi:mono/diheme cytochrome c family protein